MMKLRSLNAINIIIYLCKQSDEINISIFSKNIIEILKKVQIILSQNSKEKFDINQIID